jgi:hypothetical protein
MNPFEGPRTGYTRRHWIAAPWRWASPRWARLDKPAQDLVEDWLRGALRHVPAPNDWYLFPFTVAGFLQSVGRHAETARAVGPTVPTGQFSPDLAVRLADGT